MVHPRLQGAPEDASAALFTVFDGHCGRAAADQASTALPEELGQQLSSRASIGEDLAAGRGPGTSAWEAAFAAVDGRITAEEGTTATALLTWRGPDSNICLQVCLCYMALSRQTCVACGWPSE